jgi:hypothetical protein
MQKRCTLLRGLQLYLSAYAREGHIASEYSNDFAPTTDFDVGRSSQSVVVVVSAIQF